MSATSLFLLICALIMLLLAVAYFREAEFVNQFASLKEIGVKKPSKILSADNVALAEFVGEKMEPIKLEDVPQEIIDATITAEDRSFWTHPGIDFKGIARAIYVNLRGGKVEQGASTITQQLARNALLSSERTFQRKIREVMIAVHFEKKLTKKEILELYLNRVYYGAGAYGIKAAAKIYFGKDLKELTLAECAILSGLPQRPSAYRLRVNNDNKEALGRRDYILKGMFELGYIKPAGGVKPEERLKKALNEPLKLINRNQPYAQFKAPHFTMWVINQVENIYTQQIFDEGGWIVNTTLRYDFQQAAERALNQMLRERAYANEGAVLLLDTDGKVLAMVGSSDFKRSQYNAVVQGHRQPGSAFKPFVYAAAFDTGTLSPRSTIVDAPVSYPSGNKIWRPHNANGKYSGAVSASSALIFSINIPAIKALEMTGVNTFVEDYAKERFGFASKLDKVLPLALGASAVSPLEMARGYSVFATGGTRVEPYGIVKVENKELNIMRLFEPDITPGALNERTSHEIDNILRQVVTRGTAAGARGIHSVKNARGKTGTTSDHLDAWFCGYTDKYICVVWVANVRYNRDKNPPYEYRPMPGIFGGNTAAKVWADIMNAVQAIDEKNGIVATDKNADDEMVSVWVCKETGLIATKHCPLRERKKFKRTDAPTERCRLHDTLEPTPGSNPEEKPPTETPNQTTPTPPKNPTSEQAPKPIENPKTDVNKPDDEVVIEICPDTGLPANEYCPERVPKRYKKGEEPKGRCTKHKEGSR